MAYVDYQYYKSEYLGKMLNEESFPEYERDAVAYIDRCTYRRVKLHQELTPGYIIPDMIKDATCKAAEVLYSIDSSGGVITSESTSKHSVSYLRNSKEKEVYDAILSILSGTRWTYRGGGL